MRYLYVTVLLLFFASCNNRPVEIYPMSNIWWVYGENKHEYYVVYNAKWKSPQEIEESILAFNRKTIEIDTILKYKTSYWREFYVKTRILTKDYKEQGNDAILDHGKKRYLDITWEEYGDSLIYVWSVSKLTKHSRKKVYKLSAENIDSILHPVFTQEDAY